ncbi:MAG TPA: helix-turn-helix domain-containing protein [Anaerolineales bacterium]|nr:helix-turn-helix domain-containing protein [Anaerolineales bacterium]
MATSIPANTLEKFMTFGDLLRFLRRRMGITQMELAIQVGYSNTQISRLEQNERLPDIPTIEARFVSALGLEEEPKAVARLLDLAANVRREDAPATGLSPYKGLSYFDESDSDFFVGREALTAKLIERVLALTSTRSLHETRFLAVVGASGSGKSSLVRAGLVSALRWSKASTDWRIHILTPTAHPLESLAATLTQESNSVIATANLMDDLAQDERSLQLFTRRILESMNGSRLMLVVDQFEELFALCRSEEERAAFISNLLTAASEADGPVIVVITLRADFYAPCANYPRLRQALAAHQEYIGAMNEEELRRAIEEPAQRGRWEFEPGLVDLLLHDVGREPGALPLLSHALYETWQRRRGRTMTLSGYTSSGGVRGAIAETAEAVFADQFTHEQQAIARRIFLRLTELGDDAGAGDTRRRATFEELILKPEEAATTHAVLKALADARLITTSEAAAEVAHEALIREWPTLHGWLEENREGLRLHRQLTEAAQDWSVMNHDPDLLYRGARLAQAREWDSTHNDEMNALEVEFLAASVEAGEREAAEREAQRQRELEAAQKLAYTEKQRAEEQTHSAIQLRKRAYYLTGAFVIALIMAIAAVFFGRQAQISSRLATTRELASASISNLAVDPERSILLALQAVNKTYAVDRTVLPEAEDALRRAIQASRVELTLNGHAGPLYSAAFSPDGKRIATASADGTARIWDVSNGKELLSVKGSANGTDDPERGFTWFVTFSPDGKLLATAGGDGVARIWDASTGQLRISMEGHNDSVFTVAFSPDGNRLVTSSYDGTAKVWDVTTGKELLTVDEAVDEGVEGLLVWWATFSPDGSQVATAVATDFEGGWTSIWDVETGQKMLTLPALGPTMRSVAYSPDGARIVTTEDDRTAKLWDASSGERLMTLYGHTANVTDAKFSPDGTRIVTVSTDRQIKVWDALTGQDLNTLAGHGDGIWSVAFSADGEHIVTASDDSTAKVWRISPARELLSFDNGSRPLHPNGVKLVYSPDGTRLAVVNSDLTPKVWDVKTEKLLFELVGHSDMVANIVYSPDGMQIATASEDQTAKLWDAISGKEIRSFIGHTSTVFGIDFSPDGVRLATASSDGTATVWDTKKGEALFQLLGHTDWVMSVDYSPDGTRLVTASGDGTGIVWDAMTGKQLFALQGHGTNVRRAVYSPDGARILTASRDGTAKVWDAATGKELLTLFGHTDSIFDATFNRNGTQIATASGDQTAKVWAAITGKLLVTFPAQDGLTGVAFNPDGSQLAVGSLDGTARIYLLRIEDLMALARQRVTRSLTTEECQKYLHVEQCPLEP